MRVAPAWGVSPRLSARSAHSALLESSVQMPPCVPLLRPLGRQALAALPPALWLEPSLAVSLGCPPVPHPVHSALHEA